MSRKEFNLEQYEADFTRLQEFEKDPLSDLHRVEGQDFWEPTEYERYYLPGLRLAGIRDKNRIILQNTADLHIHTTWSDGDDLDLVLKRAVSCGLDAIAITDHDEIEGAFEARRRVHDRRMPLSIVPGCEVSSKDGHIGALFVTKRFPTGLSAQETVRLIHEAGGVAVAHHPYSPWVIDKLLGIKLGCGDLIKSIDFDAIECTNAVPGWGARYNLAAVEAMQKQHINVAVTGGSDAHRAVFVGKGKTYYAGNEGVLSLHNSLIYGFTHGAEAYWKTREKFIYYSRLAVALINNAVKKFGSVN